MNWFEVLHPQDSVALGDPPLPGGVATIVRFFFHVPQWIQIGGAVVGALAAAAIVVVVWRQRRLIWTWLTTRSRGVKLALASAVALVVLAGAGFGAVSWDYMQHDNGFCTGCHVMGPAFQRFTASEHDSLNCHDCHQQPLTASMRQLYLWVLDRPEEIGPHAPVPNRVCETCHVTAEPETWQRVASTAGHRTHLESDSSALREVMCVTCHGVEVHQFSPVDQTCAQSGCHEQSDIAIGPMQNQTALHCVTCHEFTAAVPLLATRDSAAGTLVPAREQCFSCHEMQAVLAEFDVARDPHGGTCGMCHNPHEQETAAAAARTCTTAACHVDWRAEPFHRGPGHIRIGESCILCHQPHAARVDASDCTGCHQAVSEHPDAPRGVRDRLRRLAPFDTTRALRTGGLTGGPADQVTGGLDDHGATPTARPPDRPTAPYPRASPFSGRAVELFTGFAAAFPLPPQDTFSHAQHTDLSCLTCHRTADGHGALTFAPPRGCQICHHQAPATSDCAQCHATDTLAAAYAGQVRIAVRDAPVRERHATFTHEAHGELRCVACHTAPVTLAVPATVAACSDCHDDHHAAGRACVTCHASDHVRQAHALPADAHVRCDACHEPVTVARLTPDRSFCLTCHQPQAVDHHAERECTVCHMLAEPEAFRGRLTGGAR